MSGCELLPELSGGDERNETILIITTSRVASLQKVWIKIITFPLVLLFTHSGLHKLKHDLFNDWWRSTRKGARHQNIHFWLVWSSRSKGPWRNANQFFLYLEPCVPVRSEYWGQQRRRKVVWFFSACMKGTRMQHVCVCVSVRHPLCQHLSPSLYTLQTSCMFTCEK